MVSLEKKGRSLLTKRPLVENQLVLVSTQLASLKGKAKQASEQTSKLTSKQAGQKSLGQEMRSIS